MGWLARAGQGLGRVRNALLPVPEEVASQLDPRTIEALRKQAVLQMGLGMMSAGEKRQGLGTAALYGLDQAQQGLGQGLNQAWLGSRARREDARVERQDQRQTVEMARAAAHDERQLEQDRLERERYANERAYREAKDAEAQARWEQGRKDDYAQLGMRLDASRQDQADAETRAAQRQAMQDKRVLSGLRKEYRSLPSVKDYETILPIYESVRKSPDTGYGDLDLIYGVGKILDPGSVVREGELKLAIAAGSPLQRILGTTRFTLEKGGRLNPVVRKQIVDMLENRVGSYRSAYERDRSQYGVYAAEQGFNPDDIVSTHSASAYDKTAPLKEVDVGSVIDVGAAAPSGLGQSTGPTTRRKVNW